MSRLCKNKYGQHARPSELIPPPIFAFSPKTLTHPVFSTPRCIGQAATTAHRCFRRPTKFNVSRLSQTVGPRHGRTMPFNL
eukprot:9403792-Pyramimonas_sp.AAC.1